MKLPISIIVFIFLTFNALSQRAFFEKESIVIGDQIKFTLEVSKQKGKEIEFPVFENELIPGIEIISTEEIKQDKEENILFQNFVVTSFEDSLFLVHPFEFSIDGQKVQTNATKLKVLNFQPDSIFLNKIDTTGQVPLVDIKDPLDAPLTFKEFIQRYRIIIVSLLALSALFFAIRFFLRKRKVVEQIEIKSKPKIPAYIKAKESIQKLKDQGLHKQEDLKPFYSRLSEIIRIYLEDRFSIKALESVTNEIMSAFEKTSYWNHETDSKLRVLLSLSDTVKFAKNRPDDHENELMFEYALSFINKTKEETVLTNNITKED